MVSVTDGASEMMRVGSAAVAAADTAAQTPSSAHRKDALCTASTGR